MIGMRSRPRHVPRDHAATALVLKRARDLITDPARFSMHPCVADAFGVSVHPCSSQAVRWNAIAAIDLAGHELGEHTGLAHHLAQKAARRLNGLDLREVCAYKGHAHALDALDNALEHVE